MKTSNISRRQFLKTSVLASVALSLPAAMARPLAAIQFSTEDWPLNDFMMRQIAAKQISDPADFIFCADIHVPFDDRGTFKTIIKKANDLKVDFLLFGGDSVQVGNMANFGIFLREMKKFNMPVVCAIGNHDTSFDDYADQKEWTKRFGATRFSFDAGGNRIIALNNADFALQEEDYAFLEKSVSTGLRKIIIMHRPVPYLNPLYGTPMQDAEGRFRAIVEKAGVTAVLTGHEHHYGYYEINGVKYIVSGGAGGKLNDNTENNFHHFLHIKSGKASFKYEVVKI